MDRLNSNRLTLINLTINYLICYFNVIETLNDCMDYPRHVVVITIRSVIPKP